MNDRIVTLSSLIIVALLFSITVAPSLAFIYPDGSQDNYFENYGPRIDQILVKKYASLQSEIDALKAGEIDFTDWALERPMIDDLSTDANIAIVGYGGEAGYYTLDFNNNPNQYLGNPPDPLYPNPVYATNPCAVTEFRQACSYLVDRNTLCSGPGQGMYEPIFTPIPAYMGFWIHPEISYTGLRSALAYPPSIANAAAKLDAGHFILTGSPDGYRYWDKNANGAYDGAAEDLNVIFYTRADALRRGAANMLIAGFGDPQIKIKITDYPYNSYQKVMVEKDYHIYTMGWTSIGPDPDYLYDLYHWDNYYHPGIPPNFGAISQYDPAMQTALEGIKSAPDPTTAVGYAYELQELFAENACEVPLASTSSPKAYNKWYTGGNDGQMIGDGEDKYRGKDWTDVVNEKGIGENSWWTTLNAYPEGEYFGDGNMIMRYGWQQNDMPQTLNPMYSSWYWESEICSRVYDCLGIRDPMTKGPVEVPQLAQNWTVGTWPYPSNGETLVEKDLLTIIMRPDVFWSDGHKVDIEDIIYTFCGLPEQLRDKGCPDVWWQPTIDQIICCWALDSNAVCILMDNRAPWSMNQVIGNVIIPKHIWQPYIATHTVAEISGDFSGQPDMLVGTGPFLFVENTPSTVLMRRNPLYFNTLHVAAEEWTHTYGGGYTLAQGITTTAILPSIQVSPGIIGENGTGYGYVLLDVPVTNLNLEFSSRIHLHIELQGSSTWPLFDGFCDLNPGETKHYVFCPLILFKGFYSINVAIETTGGFVHDWVIANLPSDLWPLFLSAGAHWKLYICPGSPADVDTDGDVDIFDLVVVAIHFDSTIGVDPKPGWPEYDARADLNRDGHVDIFDIVVVAVWYGWGFV